MPSIKGRTSHRPRGTRRGSVSQRMDARLEVDPALGDGPDVGRLLSEMRVRAVAKGSQSPWISSADATLPKRPQARRDVESLPSGPAVDLLDAVQLSPDLPAPAATRQLKAHSRVRVLRSGAVRRRGSAHPLSEPRMHDTGCSRLRRSAGGLGLGSLSFAIARNWTPAPAGVQNDIAAGHGLVPPHECRRPQRIALTLSIMYVFPMTSHLELVAQLSRVWTRRFGYDG